MITGRTQVFGLIGHPVRHSLSPAMHNALFAELGIDAVYVAFDVFPDRAHLLADAIRTLDLRGVNLTVPFKAAILPALQSRTAAVDEALAANVVVHHAGELSGYNTDGEGFVRGFEEAFGPIAGRRAVVLGAGGAGRAVAAGLAERNAAAVLVLNRSPFDPKALAARFPTVAFATGPLDPDGFAAAGAADLVVNCTSGDAAPLVERLPIELLPAHAVWCDINYWMADPPALARCRARGLAVQDGLPMLVHQGALSFELFTGVPVDAAHIRARLR